MKKCIKNNVIDTITRERCIELLIKTFGQKQNVVENLPNYKLENRINNCQTEKKYSVINSKGDIPIENEIYNWNFDEVNSFLKNINTKNKEEIAIKFCSHIYKGDITTITNDIYNIYLKNVEKDDQLEEDLFNKILNNRLKEVCIEGRNSRNRLLYDIYFK